jgi:iron complex transport system ATP-binding protein
MRALTERGFEVTAGVLHDTDTDSVAAERLNLLRVTVPAFAVIDPASEADAAALARAAALVVLCDPPFGPGNLANLRVAAAAVDAGAPLAVLEGSPIDARDFTGGLATELWRSLAARAHVFASAEEIAHHAERVGGQSTRP